MGSMAFLAVGPVTSYGGSSDLHVVIDDGKEATGAVSAGPAGRKTG